MNNVNKTLYIPLYGKAYVSRRGVILQDTKAEEIWAAEGFPLKGKSASKWLSFYMGMRAAVFDRWVKQQLQATPDAAVLHLGCGMDSRNLRVGETSVMWYDIDFEDVIAQRRKYYTETEKYVTFLKDNFKSRNDYVTSLKKYKQYVALYNEDIDLKLLEIVEDINSFNALIVCEDYIYIIVFYFPLFFLK